MALHQPNDSSDEFVSGASEERFQAIAEASPDAAYAYEHDSPAKVMSLANRAITSSDPETLLTAFYGVLSVGDGRLVCCSAGHPPC